MNIQNVPSAGSNGQQPLTSTFYTGSATPAQISAAWKWLFNQAQNAQEKQEVAGEMARYGSDPSGQPTAPYSITGNLLLNSALQGIDPFQPGDIQPQDSFQQSVENFATDPRQTAEEKMKELRAKEAAEQAKLLGQVQIDRVP